MSSLIPSSSIRVKSWSGWQWIQRQEFHSMKFASCPVQDGGLSDVPSLR